MQARSGGSGEGGGASRRSQRTLTIGLGLGHGGALAAAVNLLSCAPAPTFLFIALRDEGPSARRTVGRPRSGRGSRAQLTVGPIDGDQSNILPLDLTLLLKLNLIYLFPIPSQISA